MTCEKELRDVAERLSSRFLGVEPSDHHKTECCSKDDEIADLKRQLEDAKEQADIHRQWNLGYMKSNDNHRTALLASLARESRLRAFSLDQWWYSELKSLLDFPEITDDAKRAIIGVIPNLIGQIQALPQDDTALKEYRNQVIEECAVICDGDSNYDDMTGSDCAKLLREMKVM